MAVQPLRPIQKRLRILGQDEIEALYGRPRFTPEERAEYFALAAPEIELLQSLRSVKSQAYFVLQLGYFKVKRRFFIFDLHEVKDDLAHVLARHFDDAILDDLSAIDKDTRVKQQRLMPNSKRIIALLSPA